MKLLVQILQKGIKEKETTLSECQADFVNIKKKIDQILVGKQQREIQMKQQELQNVKLDEQVRDLQKLKSSLQLEVYNLKKKLTESDKDHNKELNKVKSIITSFEKDKKAAEDQRDQYCQVLASLRSTLDQEKILTSNLQRNLGEKVSEINSQRESINSLKLEVKDVTNRNELKLAQLASTESELAKCTEINKKMSIQLDEIQLKLKKKKLLVKKLEQKNYDRKKKLKRCQQNLEEKYVKLTDKYKNTIDVLKVAQERRKQKLKQKVDVNTIKIVLQNEDSDLLVKSGMPNLKTKTSFSNIDSSESTKPISELDQSHEDTEFSLQDKELSIEETDHSIGEYDNPSKELDYNEIYYDEKESMLQLLDDNIPVNETGNSTLDLVNETLRNLYEVSNDTVEDTSAFEDSRLQGLEITNILMDDMIQSVIKDSEEHTLLVDIVEDFLKNDLLDDVAQVCIKDTSKLEPETSSSLNSSFSETSRRSPTDEYQQFKFKVADTVKKCLKTFYNNEYQFGKFRIVSEEHFTDLCRNFSHRFREELKDSHVAFSGSIFGLELTPDHEMYIKQQIDFKLDNLQQ